MARGAAVRRHGAIVGVIAVAIIIGASTVGCAGVRPDKSGAGGESGAGGGGHRAADAAVDAAAGQGGQGPATFDGGSAAGSAGGCKNLQCQQRLCPGGNPTTLSGTVYAPNGTLPLYNALVYVPNGPVPPLPTGLVCDRCGALPAGEPLVGAITDAHGQFTLNNVPVGTDIPLVIQVGKWRRQVRVPSVVACQSNTIDDHELTRLPRNRQEGDLPRIAVTTGTCDNLICLVPKLGIDPSEWGIAGEGKPLTFYRAYEMDPYPAFDAHLAQMTSASTLWGNLTELSQYDMVLLSCECDEHRENKGDAAYDAMNQYMGMGGRVFSSDYQYVWYKYSPDPKVRATAVVDPTSNHIPLVGTPVRLETGFPKGKALADWYAFVNPAPGSTYGKLVPEDAFDTFSKVVAPAGQVWGTSLPNAPNIPSNPVFFSMNAPVGLPADQQCGRATHLDAHIVTTPVAKFQHFPADCGTLSPGEMVMAFFLFDAAACVQDDAKPPAPPIIIN